MTLRYTPETLLRSEIDWSGQGDGKVLAWSDALGRFEFMEPSGTPGTSAYQPIIVPLVHANVIAPNGQVVSGATFTLNAADWTGKTVEWFSTVWSVAGSSVTVLLRNLTDGETLDWQTVVSAAPGTGYCQLTVGSASGNLKTTAKVYQIIVTPTGTDTAILGSSYLRISEPA